MDLLSYIWDRLPDTNKEKKTSLIQDFNQKMIRKSVDIYYLFDKGNFLL